MKLAQRQLVDGTEPHIYVGRRINRDRATSQSVESNRWWAEYCVNGRQRHTALGTGNRQAAIQKAWEIQRNLTAGQTTAVSTRTTLKEIVEGYIEFQTTRGRSPKTIEKYQLIARNILNWSAGGQHRATSLTEDDFYRFRKGLVDAGLAEKTVHDRSVVFKQMLKWAVSRKLLARNPFADIPLPKPEPTPQPVLTTQQVGLLLEKANDHMRPIIATLVWTGLRFGELAELRWADLQINDHGKADFVISKGGSTPGKTKGRRSRRVPINPHLMVMLKGLPRSGERIFTAMPTRMYPDTERPLNERRVLMSFKQLCRKCGFENWRKLKLHSLRHTFASVGVKEGLPERYMLGFMGQRSSAILDLYVHMYDEAAHQAISVINYPIPSADGTKEKSSCKRKKKTEATAG